MHFFSFRHCSWTHSLGSWTDVTAFSCQARGCCDQRTNVFLFFDQKYFFSVKILTAIFVVHYFFLFCPHLFPLTFFDKRHPTSPAALSTASRTNFFRSKYLMTDVCCQRLPTAKHFCSDRFTDAPSQKSGSVLWRKELLSSQFLFSNKKKKASVCARFLRVVDF